MYFAKLTNGGTSCGLTNQLFSLITAILIAHSKKHKVICIGSFMEDINTRTYTPISNILDLDKMNDFLKSTYGIRLVDKYRLKYYIQRIEPLHIQGQKHMRFTYYVNGELIEEVLDEKEATEMSKNVLKPIYKYTFGWIDTIHKAMFENILIHIRYHPDFTNKTDSLTSHLDTVQNKINVIHLRLEEDAIHHWSKINHMTGMAFRDLLVKKYISLIKEYISQTDQTIILSHSLNNPVIDFLKKNNYTIFFNQNDYGKREKDAIIDYLTSTRCNNVFIGNFNFRQMNGSTFSYYIGKTIDAKVKRVFIDLDRVLTRPEIYI
jgi:hypothetical protein